MTPRQTQILAYQRAYHAANGCMPTQDEIGKQFGISKTTVWEHLKAMEKAGILVGGGKHKSRAYRFADSAEVRAERYRAALEKIWTGYGSRLGTLEMAGIAREALEG